MDSGQYTCEVRFICDMQRLSPQPGDVFVITTDAHISQAQRHALMSAWAIAMPGNKVLVMGGGMRIGVVGQQPETPNAELRGLPLDIPVMHLAAMEVGKRYVVTKASDDGTFEIGDHITLHADGTIGCRESAGWIEQPDVEEAMKGCEFAIDQEWIERRKQKLMQELALLNAKG